MEDFRKAIRNISNVSKSGAASPSSSSSPFERLNPNQAAVTSGGTSAMASSDQSHLIVTTRASRQVVSLWTCSKLCALCFAAGVIFGYTLRRRVRRWASNILKRLKDN